MSKELHKQISSPELWLILNEGLYTGYDWVVAKRYVSDSYIYANMPIKQVVAETKEMRELREREGLPVPPIPEEWKYLFEETTDKSSEEPTEETSEEPKRNITVICCVLAILALLFALFFA